MNDMQLTLISQTAGSNFFVCNVQVFSSEKTMIAALLFFKDPAKIHEQLFYELWRHLGTKSYSLKSKTRRYEDTKSYVKTGPYEETY